jgi:hypothetical protein
MGRRGDLASLATALAVKPGQTDRLRAFCKEVIGSRRSEFEATERRIGLTREGWYLQRTPTGDLAIIWVEGPDPRAALALFAQSEEPFDAWFKREAAEITSVDPNHLPEDMAEVLFDWSASR